MENNQNLQSSLFSQTDEKTYEQTLVQSFFTQTYTWMFLALILSAVSAFFVANNPALLKLIILNRVVFYGLLIVEIGFVFVISAFINKMSVATALLSLFAYAIINGATLSVIFVVFSLSTIGIAFITSASIYGIMALYGTFTKSNLSPLGSFCLFALLGGLVISFINIVILHSSTLNLITSLAFVLIFAGLTAFDHQKLKEIVLQSQNASKSDITKLSIYGALQLYLDFINLFLNILSLFGRD